MKDGLPRFPSPLLEALLEGLVLFIILALLRRKDIFPGKIATAFLFWYGIFRFAVEFARTPDTNLGYLSYGLTMGQILSVPMIVIGGILYLWFRFSGKKEKASY